MSHRWLRRAVAPALILALAACSDDEISAPTDPVEGELTVDAADGWAFVSLADEGTVTVLEPRGSAEWDLGFNSTNVMLNGGAAGPAGVTGYCVCANASATNEQVLAMTAESELADFDAVTLEDAPATGWEADELVPAISGWYSGSGESAVVDEGAWLLRLANGTSYAKVRVASIAEPTDEHAGQVTVEYAVQATAGDAFGPTESVTLDAGQATPTSLDLATGETNVAQWDIAVHGFTILVNGGVSGEGEAAAAVAEQSFDDITTAVTDPRAYVTDRFGGIFTARPWYRYNLTGEHGIHPTYDVYLVKRGEQIYKIQILDYYSPAGEPRNITLRYARLTD